MPDEASLHERLREIEATYARPAPTRADLDGPVERLRRRLGELRATEPDVEFRAGVSDEWAQQLLAALCQRYGIEVYRYRRQRSTTAMVQAPRSFIEETLWPLFEALQREMRIYVHGVTARAIAALDGTGAGSTDAAAKGD